MAFAIPSSSNRTNRFPVYSFHLAYPITGSRIITSIIPPDLVSSSYSTIFTNFARWRFRLLFSAAYLSGILLSDCCYRAVHHNLYPDQNPFAGSGLSFHTVAPCTLRHRFCISSACPSSLLWVHPTPLNALVWLSHTGYTSPTFAPLVEFIDPETSWVLTQPQGGR
jgi:hypothetical protein